MSSRTPLRHDGNYQDIYWDKLGIPTYSDNANHNVCWLYGGKEFEREHSLLTYDYHARPYDPALCRFTATDPLAAKYERLN